MNRHSGKLTAIILALIIIAGMLCVGMEPYAYIANSILALSGDEHLTVTGNSSTIVIDPGHGGYR